MGSELSGNGLSDGYLPIDEQRFVSPAVVKEWIAGDPGASARTWPEVLHLDQSGALTCGARASTSDHIRQWAIDPEYLAISRAIGQLEGGCGVNWLIIETRHPFHDLNEVTEADAKAFMELRRMLTQVGVNLVDIVIVDDQKTACSLHELERPGAAYALIADESG